MSKSGPQRQIIGIARLSALDKNGRKITHTGGKCVGKISGTTKGWDLSNDRNAEIQLKAKQELEARHTGALRYIRLSDLINRQHKQTTQTDQTDGFLIWARRKKKWSWKSEILMVCRLIDVMAEQVSPSESKSSAEMETSNSRPTLDLEYGPAGKSTHAHWWGRSWSVDSPSLS